MNENENTHANFQWKFSGVEMITYVQTPVGNLKVKFDTRNRIRSIEFTEEETDLSYTQIPELKQFFSNSFQPEKLDSLHLVGTDFQKTVWKELQKIPVGETRTYSQIAEQIGKPTAYRAVANACGANPIVLLVPCHRVIAKNGLGGYSQGIENKKLLLEYEKSLVKPVERKVRRRRRLTKVDEEEFK